ncbi:MAG: hypothetical protein KDA78_14070 [Planctomycetaceae bacterium]|nr:hypothetical protein [Planctomycetaceae bacterium]
MFGHMSKALFHCGCVAILIGFTHSSIQAQPGNRGARPEPRDLPEKGLRYDPLTKRWVYDEPSQQPVPPGPLLTPPTILPPTPSGQPNYGPTPPPAFEWSYEGQREPYWSRRETYPTHPNSPGVVDANRYPTLASQLSHNLRYLQALTIRENLTPQQRQLVFEAGTHAEHFAQLLMAGGDFRQVQQEFEQFDTAWHPAAHLFTTGAFSNRTLSVVQSINQIDNLFHAEMNFGQAHAYDHQEVVRLSQELVRWSAEIATEFRTDRRYGIPQAARLTDGVARSAQRFAQTVQRDGDHDDVVKAFRNVESAWEEVHAAIFQGNTYFLRDWQAGRAMYQTLHDLRMELHLVPAQQQPVQLQRLVSELQRDSQVVLQLLNEQTQGRGGYLAWVFAQDCYDLSVALSTGQGSFHRQIPQTLASWRDVRAILDGQQFVGPIQSIERNLRILETIAD